MSIKTHPIFYSTPMVTSIIEGGKHVTRRRVKDQEKVLDRKGKSIKCPYGKVGDLLWVRETHNIITIDGKNSTESRTNPFNPEYIAYYKASYPNWLPPPRRWLPSIHMPRWASRITQEIVGVWCERLQDISEALIIVSATRRYERIFILLNSLKMFRNFRWLLNFLIRLAQTMIKAYFR